MIKNKKNLKPHVIASIFKAFSKMKDNKMAGNESFFEGMEETIIDHIQNNNFTLLELSEIMYAYSIRASGSDKLYTSFIENLNNNIGKAANYAALANITWFLLFTKSTDQVLWQGVTDAFNKIEEKLPIHYYRPFRLAAYYVQDAVPELNFDDVMDKFYDPEQLFDYMKQDKQLRQRPEYITLKGMLNGRLMIFPIANVIYDNALIVHYCFEHRKIGINLWLERDLVPKSKKLNKMRELDSYILRKQGWEMLDISWDELFNMPNQDERDKYIHDWFHKASIEQEKKGIFKINPLFV